MRLKIFMLTLGLVVGIAAGCGGESTATDQTDTGSALPRGSEKVELDPSEFTTKIDNPYWPMAPGSHWVYVETDGKRGEARVQVTVTSQSKSIAGIQAVVVHDVVSEDGELVEDTYDWYAQDAEGNIWYLGEDTKEYENGKVKSTEGSWEAGVDGAQAGILLPAHPKPGLAYRQEYYKGEAEDAPEVLSIEEKAEVPFGSFDHVLLTRDYTPLEPDLVEHKFYARGVGPVLAMTVSGGSDREELVGFEHAGS